MGGLRLTFGVLERVAPGPGAVLAERIWCTVPRGAVHPPEVAGERFTVPVHGRTVVAEAWGAGPVVYLMHGWGGWRGQFTGFVAPLVAAGHRVIAFDAPSHGDSAPGAYGPRRGLLPEFVDALEAVVRIGGPAHTVIGHSLGGAATAIAALDGLPAERLVLISAMADPIAYTSDFARALGFGERIRTGFLHRLERRVGRRMPEFDVRARVAGQTQLPPVFVVHDRADRQVRFTDGEALAAAWPEAELLVSEGLGHRRILRDPAIIASVVDYVAGARVGRG
ncbi:alpha/beta fold hydrolase [Plantactinospora soyae]|uniref:Pimeloyl-ACP methyl ester carboxylesterase n=1 Tax=Plantactinospora soyae TaxID=1544732 RepID=A0A927R7T1_9ACTN|nr:alpha/beta fold hydrolase [Plantactinospora soyae]MBE1488161.1 pimeloyl-ACP methyl ester carboxylesterase [Plantactinospora soyae]